jgi:hypothetical protein
MRRNADDCDDPFNLSGFAGSCSRFCGIASQAGG